MQGIRSLGLIMATVMLTACGGGGGGGASASVEPTVALSDDNVSQAVESVLFEPQGIDAALYLFEDFYYGVYEDAAVYEESVSAAAVYEDEIQCSVNGSIKIYVDLASEYEPSVGDFVDVSFVRCDDGSGVMNGRFVVDVLRLNDNAAEFRFEAFDLSFIDQYENFLIDGDLTLLVDGLRADGLFSDLSVRSDRLVVTEFGEEYSYTGFSYNLAETAAGSSLSIKGAIAAPNLGGQLYITTQEAFDYEYGTWSAGLMTIEGSAGSSVRVSASADPGYLQIEEDFDGDGVYAEPYIYFIN